MESGFVGGPRSPISFDELGKKSPAELLEYIRSWLPQQEGNGETDGWHHEAESVAGLAGVLTTVVQSRPEEFSRIAQQFIGLDPTYVRGFLEGIFNAARKRDTIDWAAVIGLCHWAAGELAEIGSRDALGDRDTNWTWTKQTITRVLQEGLNEESNAVPFLSPDEVWDTIKTLLHSPDVLQGNEEAELSSHFDPLTRSLNTVSGSALHAAIKYALWVRHFDKTFQGISSISEFAAALDYVLERPEVYGLTSRAVLGQWFPWLVLIDATWAKDQVDRIFPEQKERARLWEAAWSTYMDSQPTATPRMVL